MRLGIVDCDKLLNGSFFFFFFISYKWMDVFDIKYRLE